MIYPWTEDAWKQFEQRRQQGRLAHACLLSGPAGLGKLELARQIGASMLCLDPGNIACGVCRSCALLASGAHPDFRQISFETNQDTGVLRTELVISQVRELISLMQLTSSLSPRKLALIHPAEAMNRNSANALLKTLEEPPGEGFLLLVSHQPGRLPPTIRSRCQNLEVHLPEAQRALEWLVADTGSDHDLAAQAMEASGGVPLRARKLLQQGQVESFQAVQNTLASLHSRAAGVSEALESLAKVDPDNLWIWLSVISAEALRSICLPASSAATHRAQHLTIATNRSRAHHVADLQLLADRNRRLLATSVRKDLLLRDWLIQWAASGSS